MKNSLKLFSIIFTLFGALFIITAAVLALVFGSIKSSRVKTEAVITGFGHSSTEIQFEAGGKTVNRRIDTYSSDWEKGDKLTVYYDPGDPEKITDGFVMRFLPALFGGLGGLFALIGIIPPITEKNATRRKQYLLENGVRLDAEVIFAEPNYSIRINGRSPYRIICRYTDPEGITHIFKSGNIYNMPVGSFVGETVAVFHKPGNLDKYLVDTSDLKKTDVIYH